MSILRVGLSGCGEAGLQLVRGAQAARAHGDIEVVALHDDEPQRLAHAQQATGIRLGTGDFRQLLATGVDFVVLAGPTTDRRQQVQEASEQAAPCLVHTPLAADLATAEQLMQIAQAHGLPLGVIVPAHHDPLYEQVRRMLATDWLGGLVSVQALAGDDALLRAPGELRLHPFVERAGPLLHTVSWLCGRSVLSVTAQTVQGYGPADDGGVATALLRGNVLATFAASHTTAARALALHGTDGGVRVAGDRIWLRGRSTFHGTVFDYPEAGVEVVLDRRDLTDALTTAATAIEPLGCFARALDDRDDFPCSGEQALQDLRAIDAMVRAARSGRREVP